jgi:hypothetical protein
MTTTPPPTPPIYKVTFGPADFLATKADRSPYTPPALSFPAPVTATSSGLFHDAGMLATWQQRALNGPWKSANDFAPHSYGEWDRVISLAEQLCARPGDEPAPNVAVNYDINTNGAMQSGGLAVAASFAYRVGGQTKYLTAALDWLLKRVNNPANDISLRGFSISTNGGASWDMDGMLEFGAVNRLISTYNNIRHALTFGDRVTIEKAIQRYAYFAHQHLSWGLESLFPNRLAGDYHVLGQQIHDWHNSEAMAYQDGVPYHAFIFPNGAPGPQIPIIALYYNNRRAQEALCMAMAGVLLNDGKLIGAAKTYFREWLAYAVHPTGAQGEWNRNLNYGIAFQGEIYGDLNIAAYLDAAVALHHYGDDELLTYQTTDGLFGFGCLPGEPAKTVLTPMMLHLDLIAGRKVLFAHERNVAPQVPRQATCMCGQTSAYFGSNPIDNWHDIGYAIALPHFDVPAIRKTVLRLPAPGMPTIPGATGNQVAGYFGSTTVHAAPAFAFVPPAMAFST